MDQLMQKLMISKAIMDKHDGMKRGDARDINIPQTTLESFDAPQARYNIPQEFLQEQEVNQPYLSSVPKQNTKAVGVPTVDAIKNSKLPDEIKKLMMEHPIAQPQQPQVTLSNDLIEKAARLMKENSNNYVPDSAKKQTVKQEVQQTNSNIDYKLIQKMINEAVKSALKENGLIVESSEKTNELFQFKVGKHLFEGRVTKVKKVS
jgi:hypothetical protein